MSTLREIFGNVSTIDFRPKWRIAFVVSLLLLLGSVGLLLGKGLNRSIDFEGGGKWEVPIGDDVSVADARNVLPDIGDPRIQIVDLSGAEASPKKRSEL